jgi:hypothetical protein
MYWICLDTACWTSLAMTYFFKATKVDSWKRPFGTIELTASSEVAEKTSSSSSLKSSSTI